MRKNPILFLSTWAMLSAFSISPALAHNPPPPINEVTFNLTAQEWAKTDTAKVTVSIHAAMDNKTLAKMREQIMDNLNKIAKGNWHITTFQRTQDSSDLEKLYVEAEARVGEADLTNVNTEAKNISQSGMKYEVESIDFSPSVADVEKVKKELRDDIYRQAQAEINTLNQLYPNQKYALHGIRFGEFVAATNAIRASMVMMTSGSARPQAQVVNTVNNLVTLTADVDIASEGLPSSSQGVSVSSAGVKVD